VIDLALAKKEIAKLGSANLQFPPDKDGMSYLARTLSKRAVSETHAAAVIDRWIEHWPQWPKPSEIVSACENITDPKQAAITARRQNCGECHGTGWLTVRRGEYEGVKRCECSAVCV
jgi:hypothetical protein